MIPGSKDGHFWKGKLFRFLCFLKVSEQIGRGRQPLLERGAVDADQVPLAELHIYHLQGRFPLYLAGYHIPITPATLQQRLKKRDLSALIDTFRGLQPVDQIRQLR